MSNAAPVQAANDTAAAEAARKAEAARRAAEAARRAAEEAQRRAEAAQAMREKVQQAQAAKRRQAEAAGRPQAARQDAAGRAAEAKALALEGDARKRAKAADVASDQAGRQAALAQRHADAAKAADPGRAKAEAAAAGRAAELAGDKRTQAQGACRDATRDTQGLQAVLDRAQGQTPAGRAVGTSPGTADAVASGGGRNALDALGLDFVWPQPTAGLKAGAKPWLAAPTLGPAVAPFSPSPLSARIPASPQPYGPFVSPASSTTSTTSTISTTATTATPATPAAPALPTSATPVSASVPGDPIQAAAFADKQSRLARTSAAQARRDALSADRAVRQLEAAKGRNTPERASALRYAREAAKVAHQRAQQAGVAAAHASDRAANAKALAQQAATGEGQAAAGTRQAAADAAFYGGAAQVAANDIAGLADLARHPAAALAMQADAARNQRAGAGASARDRAGSGSKAHAGGATPTALQLSRDAAQFAQRRADTATGLANKARLDAKVANDQLEQARLKQQRLQALQHKTGNANVRSALAHQTQLVKAAESRAKLAQIRQLETGLAAQNAQHYASMARSFAAQTLLASQPGMSHQSFVARGANGKSVSFKLDARVSSTLTARAAAATDLGAQQAQAMATGSAKSVQKVYEAQVAAVRRERAQAQARAQTQARAPAPSRPRVVWVRQPGIEPAPWAANLDKAKRDAAAADADVAKWQAAVKRPNASDAASDNASKNLQAALIRQTAMHGAVTAASRPHVPIATQAVQARVDQQRARATLANPNARDAATDHAMAMLDTSTATLDVYQKYQTATTLVDTRARALVDQANGKKVATDPLAPPKDLQGVKTDLAGRGSDASIDALFDLSAYEDASYGAAGASIAKAAGQARQSGQGGQARWLDSMSTKAGYLRLDAENTALLADLQVSGQQAAQKYAGFGVDRGASVPIRPLDAYAPSATGYGNWGAPPSAYPANMQAANGAPAVNTAFYRPLDGAVPFGPGGKPAAWLVPASDDNTAWRVKDGALPSGSILANGGDARLANVVIQKNADGQFEASFDVTVAGKTEHRTQSLDPKVWSAFQSQQSDLAKARDGATLGFEAVAQRQAALYERLGTQYQAMADKGDIAAAVMKQLPWAKTVSGQADRTQARDAFIASFVDQPVGTPVLADVDAYTAGTRYTVAAAEGDLAGKVTSPQLLMIDPTSTYGPKTPQELRDARVAMANEMAFDYTHPFGGGDYTTELQRRNEIWYPTRYQQQHGGEPPLKLTDAGSAKEPLRQAMTVWNGQGVRVRADGSTPLTDKELDTTVAALFGHGGDEGDRRTPTGTLVVQPQLYAKTNDNGEFNSALLLGIEQTDAPYRVVTNLGRGGSSSHIVDNQKSSWVMTTGGAANGKFYGHAQDYTDRLEGKVDKFQAGLEIAGGIVELGLGVAAIATGVGSVGGAIAVLDGLQHIAHAGYDLHTGKQSDGFISQGAQAMGASEDAGNRFEAGVGLGLAFVGGAGGLARAGSEFAGLAGTGSTVSRLWRAAPGLEKVDLALNGTDVLSTGSVVFTGNSFDPVSSGIDRLGLGSRTGDAFSTALGFAVNGKQVHGQIRERRIGPTGTVAHAADPLRELPAASSTAVPAATDFSVVSGVTGATSPGSTRRANGVAAPRLNGAPGVRDYPAVSVDVGGRRLSGHDLSTATPVVDPRVTPSGIVLPPAGGNSGNLWRSEAPARWSEGDHQLLAGLHDDADQVRVQTADEARSAFIPGRDPMKPEKLLAGKTAISRAGDGTNVSAPFVNLRSAHAPTKGLGYDYKDQPFVTRLGNGHYTVNDADAFIAQLKADYQRSGAGPMSGRTELDIRNTISGAEPDPDATVRRLLDRPGGDRVSANQIEQWRDVMRTGRVFAVADGVPGSHAEVLALNDLRNGDAASGRPASRSSVATVATLKLDPNAADRAFDACNNCSLVVPRTVRVITERSHRPAQLPWAVAAGRDIAAPPTPAPGGAPASAAHETAAAADPVARTTARRSSPIELRRLQGDGYESTVEVDPALADVNPLRSQTNCPYTMAVTDRINAGGAPQSALDLNHAITSEAFQRLYGQPWEDVAPAGGAGPVTMDDVVRQIGDVAAPGSRGFVEIRGANAGAGDTTHGFNWRVRSDGSVEVTDGQLGGRVVSLQAQGARVLQSYDPRRSDNVDVNAPAFGRDIGQGNPLLAASDAARAPVIQGSGAGTPPAASQPPSQPSSPPPSAPPATPPPAATPAPRASKLRVAVTLAGGAGATYIGTRLGNWGIDHVQLLNNAAPWLVPAGAFGRAAVKLRFGHAHLWDRRFNRLQSSAVGGKIAFDQALADAQTAVANSPDNQKYVADLQALRQQQPRAGVPERVYQRQLLRRVNDLSAPSRIDSLGLSENERHDLVGALDRARRARKQRATFEKNLDLHLRLMRKIETRYGGGQAPGRSAEPARHAALRQGVQFGLRGMPRDNAIAMRDRLQAVQARDIALRDAGSSEVPGVSDVMQSDLTNLTSVGADLRRPGTAVRRGIDIGAMTTYSLGIASTVSQGLPAHWAFGGAMIAAANTADAMRISGLAADGILRRTFPRLPRIGGRMNDASVEDSFVYQKALPFADEALTTSAAIPIAADAWQHFGSTHRLVYGLRVGAAGIFGAGGGFQFRTSLARGYADPTSEQRSRYLMSKWGSAIGAGSILATSVYLGIVPNPPPLTPGCATNTRLSQGLPPAAADKAVRDSKPESIPIESSNPARRDSFWGVATTHVDKILTDKQRQAVDPADVSCVAAQALALRNGLDPGKLDGVDTSDPKDPDSASVWHKNVTFVLGDKKSIFG